jgi:rhamnogalacturonyl hydrolase YesR
MKYLYLYLFLFFIVGGSSYCKAENNLLEKSFIRKELKKVADWQISQFQYKKKGSPGHLHDYGIDAWTNAVLYMGMANWAKIAVNDSSYYDWLYDIGKKSQWKLAENFVLIPAYKLYHADELCIGQFFLEMGKVFRDENLMKATQARADWIMDNLSQDTIVCRKIHWSWCDALFMAPAVYSRLSEWTQDDKYLAFMDRYFKQTYHYLYDTRECLFFRDKSYFDKKEKNGQKIFWGRGNGWVVAGLVNILKTLPPESPYRPFYENLFKEMLERLVALQDPSGCWHASLLDAESYPAPETSASALITYALAFGLRMQLLPEEKYRPAMEKAWIALLAAVGDQGKLGWVQPIGADPKSVTKYMTATYGVGAFLMAGTEIYFLVN